MKRSAENLLNPANFADRSAIRFGAPVALSCFGQPTCCLSLGAVPSGPAVRPVHMVNALGQTERWKFINPANPQSREIVAWGAVVALRGESEPGFHLSCGWSGQPPAAALGAGSVPHCAGWEWFRAWPTAPQRFVVAQTGAPRRNRPGLQAVTGGGREIDGVDRFTVAVGELHNSVLVPGSVQLVSVTWNITGRVIRSCRMRRRLRWTGP